MSEFVFWCRNKMLLFKILIVLIWKYKKYWQKYFEFKNINIKPRFLKLFFLMKNYVIKYTLQVLFFTLNKIKTSFE